MLQEGILPDDWKKSNVVPVHKKEGTNLVKNYRPISLLPIFSKIFGWLTFNYLYNYLMKNKLFAECQSGFIPGDSHALHNCCQLHMKCINDLTVTHRLTRGEFFLIFRKPLIKSGMKV